MPYKPIMDEFSWLDIGVAMSGTLSKIPGKIQEARLLDRQIREERIEAIDLYNDFQKMSVSGASDDGIRASIAARLKKKPEELSVNEAQQYLASNFRAPREGESTAKYANAMTGAWRKMFYEQANDDNLDQNLIALTYGRMGENDMRNAAQMADGMKNRKRDEALNNLEAGSDEITAEDYAKQYANVGGDITKSKRHAKLKSDGIAKEAYAIARKYTSDITGTEDWGFLRDKLVEDGTNPDVIGVVQKLYFEDLQEQEVMSKLANAKTEREASQLRMQLAARADARDEKSSSLNNAYKKAQIDELSEISDRRKLQEELEGKTLAQVDVKNIISTNQKKIDDLRSQNKEGKDKGINKQIVEAQAIIDYLSSTPVKHEFISFGKVTKPVVTYDEEYVSKLTGEKQALPISLSSAIAYSKQGKSTGFKNLKEALDKDGWMISNNQSGVGNSNIRVFKGGRVAVINKETGSVFEDGSASSGGSINSSNVSDIRNMLND